MRDWNRDTELTPKEVIQRLLDAVRKCKETKDASPEREAGKVKE